jgi:hypothetical protein
VYEATKVQRDEHEVILRVLHPTEARPTLSNPVEACRVVVVRSAWLMEHQLGRAHIA